MTVIKDAEEMIQLEFRKGLIDAGTIKYLGGKTPYYRYNRGDKLLTPEQQAWIIRRFESAGYTKDLEFDGYVTTYDFHHR